MMQDKRNVVLLSVVVALLILFTVGGIWGTMALTRRSSEAKQRASVNQYGVHQLSGPVKPGGPTWGSGDRADLETVYNGWGSNGPIDDPNTSRAVIIGVRNKSEVTWHNVEAQVAVFDSSGSLLKTEPCPFGDLRSGETKQLTFGPVEKNVGMFRLTGYKGNR
ncbi:MAG: hypothetical protein H8F28_07395 [Fibrella sp.]|nr:hypothetical protein [Armatimonadota bacterium]